MPITGFANSVAAAAIEYQTEGEVFWQGRQDFFYRWPRYFIRYHKFVDHRSDLLDIENLWCRGLICTRLDTFHCEESGSPDFLYCKKEIACGYVRINLIQ